ncbi:ADP-ribosyl-glycohydrolase superfamily protein [Syntrophotalea carbinolica DSM 2380]|uniref:ADP-ribosyl-glycohydrolase superfamily protein n=1 Tax=Syntrophotalea carbinolica (strain DSM 2380 / NBRC 103641 / GraBd1) TaxID=338963 RepID=Q3A625_SYNC1|nr:ADP-ribosylglycohydrolase family protein [Syntrophotalea carbinolica]ABA88182.1 ADP-ribosyl-glycohydrolase superfamily protein [Syntrophotalea carbinolica DSM 2380]
MLGALAGDMIGSRFEWHNIKTKAFELFTNGARFTDDTVLTVAQADALLTGESFRTKLKEYYRLYPHAGYGGRFHQWAGSDCQEPYYSFGNGSGMRVSPVGWYFNDLSTVLSEAHRSAAVTHNHPEGIKGAQAVASAIFLARSGENKAAIREFVATRFGYDFSWSLDDIRPWYRFDVTCQGSVPQALQAFFESDGFEDAVRNAVSIGGDSDTIACMAGAVAEAFYGEVPDEIAREVFKRLDEKLAGVTRRFLEVVGRSHTCS